MSVAETPQQFASRPAFARFTRRVRGTFIDSIVVLLALACALIVASSARSDPLARTIGFGLVAGVLLYEPVLVWLTGSTIGHYLSNLRVVDDRTQGNVGFPKAVARFVIKSLLGWYSFISMATTRRHQAVHDLMTHSTVQMRDPGKARPHHFIAERVEPATPDMPSRARRIAVICGYLVVCAALYLLALIGLVSVGLLSRACFYADSCAGGDKILDLVLQVSWLGATALCIILGWRGRLWGCRARQPATG
jgi:RDD family